MCVCVCVCVCVIKIFTTCRHKVEHGKQNNICPQFGIK